MKKIIALFVLAFVFVSCSSPENDCSEVFVSFDGYELKMLNEGQNLLSFSLSGNDTEVEAQVGDENYRRFINVCNNFEKGNFEEGNGKNFARVNFADNTNKQISFDEKNQNETVSEVMELFDEILLLATEDL